MTMTTITTPLNTWNSYTETKMSRMLHLTMMPHKTILIVHNGYKKNKKVYAISSCLSYINVYIYIPSSIGTLSIMIGIQCGVVIHGIILVKMIPYRRIRRIWIIIIINLVVVIIIILGFISRRHHHTIFVGRRVET